MTIVIASHPHPLPTERVNNQSPAVSETARALAGRARWLYEMLTGESGDPNEPPAIPKNPQGKYGIDHSGAPYGVAFEHPMVCGGVPFGTSNTGWNDVPSNLITSSAGGGGTAWVWVKPHPPGVGPYSQLRLEFHGAYFSSTTTLTVVATNVTADERSVEDTVTFNSGAVAAKQAVLDIPVVSGWNEIHLGIRADTGGGAYVLGWALNQHVQIRDS